MRLTVQKIRPLLHQAAQLDQGLRHLFGSSPLDLRHRDHELLHLRAAELDVLTPLRRRHPQSCSDPVRRFRAPVALRLTRLNPLFHLDVLRSAVDQACGDQMAALRALQVDLQAMGGLQRRSATVWIDADLQTGHPAQAGQQQRTQAFHGQLVVLARADDRRHDDHHQTLRRRPAAGQQKDCAENDRKQFHRPKSTQATPVLG